jgi:phage protein D
MLHAVPRPAGHSPLQRGARAHTGSSAAARRLASVGAAPAARAGRGRAVRAQASAAQKGINKVVLAYSGGLDTSVILKWLQQTYDCEVVTFTADLGQVRVGGGTRQLLVRAGGVVALCSRRHSTPAACSVRWSRARVMQAAADRGWGVAKLGSAASTVAASHTCAPHHTRHPHPHPHTHTHQTG